MAHHRRKIFVGSAKGYLQLEPLENGEPIPGLEDATVTLTLVNLATGKKALDAGECEVVSATRVRYKLEPEDVAKAGKFQELWTITLDGEATSWTGPAEGIVLEIVRRPG
jgi:hypothetical protein